MRNYEELVGAMRECSGNDYAECDCSKCPYDNYESKENHDYTTCVDKMILDAADAIEELMTKKEDMK